MSLVVFLVVMAALLWHRAASQCSPSPQCSLQTRGCCSGTQACIQKDIRSCGCPPCGLTNPTFKTPTPISPTPSLITPMPSSCSCFEVGQAPCPVTCRQSMSDYIFTETIYSYSPSGCENWSGTFLCSKIVLCSPQPPLCETPRPTPLPTSRPTPGPTPVNVIITPVASTPTPPPSMTPCRPQNCQVVSSRAGNCVVQFGNTCYRNYFIMEAYGPSCGGSDCVSPYVVFDSTCCVGAPTPFEPFPPTPSPSPSCQPLDCIYNIAPGYCSGCDYVYPVTITRNPSCGGTPCPTPSRVNYPACCPLSSSLAPTPLPAPFPTPIPTQGSSFECNACNYVDSCVNCARVSTPMFSQTCPNTCQPMRFPNACCMAPSPTWAPTNVPTPAPFLLPTTSSSDDLPTLPQIECNKLQCDACIANARSCAWCAATSECLLSIDTKRCGRVATTCAVKVKTLELVEGPTIVTLGSSRIVATMSGGMKSELSKVGVGVRPGVPVQWSFTAPVAIVGMSLIELDADEVARLNASATLASGRVRSSVDESPTINVRDAVTFFSTFERGFYVYTLEALDKAEFDVSSIDVESPRTNDLPLASPTETANPILVDNSDSDDGSTDLMIGLIVGGVLLLLIVALVIFLVVRQRRRTSNSDSTKDTQISEPPTLPRMPNVGTRTDIYGTFLLESPDPVTTTAPIPQYDSVASLRQSKAPTHTYGKAPVAPGSSLYDAIDTPL
jgi:hypothetical protein